MMPFRADARRIASAIAVAAPLRAQLFGVATAGKGGGERGIEPLCRRFLRNNARRGVDGKSLLRGLVPAASSSGTARGLFEDAERAVTTSTAALGRKQLLSCRSFGSMSGSGGSGVEDSSGTSGESAVGDLVVEKRGNEGIALIRLHRPKALNALRQELCEELCAALASLDKDSSIRCVVLTGSGDKAFAAGADIKQMKDRDFCGVSQGDMLASWSTVQSFRKPLIAAVNGYALGGGCELAMMCDIILASEKAKFGQPEILLGTIPGMGGTQRLTRAVGKSKAMEWVLTGRQFTAQEALDAGLISRVVPHDMLEAEAMKLAAEIAAFSQPAIVAAKECVNRAFESSLQEGLLFERRVFHGTFATADRAEGMSAFVEKRPPQWRHR